MEEVQQEEIVVQEESKVNSLLTRMYRFLRECRRVLKVTHKPTREEYITTVKVSAIGLAIIGMIGFLLTMIKQLLL